MKRSILALTLLCASIALLGAEGGTATIVYADGEEVTVIRERREMKVDDPLGFVVEAGDIVQTGKQTILELSVRPKKAVIRMSGNTTLHFRGSYATGETSLAVLYGRVRAKVEKLVGAERFTMRNEGTVCGVRGTDFGMDVIIDKDSGQGQSTVSVYCLEGALSVDTALSATSPVQASGIVNSGEMAEAVVKGEKVSLVSSRISDELKALWDENSFKSEAAAEIKAEAAVLASTIDEGKGDAETAEPGVESASAEDSASDEQAVALAGEASLAAAAPESGPTLDWGFEKKNLAVKNRMLGLSTLLVAAGAGIQIYGAYRIGIQENQEYADTLLLAGSLCTTTGFVTGLFGLLWNPRIPPR